MFHISRTLMCKRSLRPATVRKIWTVKLPSVATFPVAVKAPPRAKIPVGRADFTLQPMMWMFLAILITFLITRVVTRMIRSGNGGGAGIGNVKIAGNHIHHQVFGILIIIGTGIALVGATPHGTALDVAAAVFGVGVGLTVDEFALWLHLEDVYWAEQGRSSVDAIFCVLLVTGALIGGVDFWSGQVGTAGWWGSIGLLAVNLLLCLICVLKGKVLTGAVGIVIGVIALVGAIRLAKPGSWWATRRYASRPKRAERAAHRFGPRYQARWNRMRDLVAGAPTQKRGQDGGEPRLPVALAVMDDEFQVSYAGVSLGVPVLARDGEQFGVLEHVLAVEEEDIFEGIVVWTGGGGWAKRKIQRELSMGHQSAARFLETFRHNDLRFVPADKITMITVGDITCDLDRAQVSQLQPPSGAPVLYANAIDQAGPGYGNRMYGGMFGRARWQQE
jgi:hypothetical protein